MNLVLDDAEEVNVKKKSKKSLGGSLSIYISNDLMPMHLILFIFLQQEGFFSKGIT